MTPRWPVAAALLIVATASISIACGSGGESTSAANAQSRTLTLEQDDFYFAPTQLAASPGQTITVKVTNKGKADHTFTVDALKVDQVVPAGTEKDITLPAGTSGSFEYYCRFHHSKMTGTLTLGSGGPVSSSTPATGGGYGGYGY